LSGAIAYDDIVIGSGLSALGTVMGLGQGRRILVLAGPKTGQCAHYQRDRTVPCAYLGLGGLGKYWHGVIPMALASNFGAASTEEFAQLFARFYPHTSLRGHLHQPKLFVPWRPIRPGSELARLQRRSKGTLAIRTRTVARFRWHEAGVTVDTTDGSNYRADRLWIAAGSIHTPALLDRSLGRRVSRGYVSDHAFCYVGLLSGQPPPKIIRTRDGVFFPAHYDAEGKSLYTLRPARFEFRELDFGIELRAAFGMPTGSAVAKIMRRMSSGLFAEALFNRLGVFSKAEYYSVYAQTDVPDAYAISDGNLPLAAQTERILRVAAESRERVPFNGVRHSRRRDLYIPGIHLHHSVAPEALEACGIDQPQSPVKIMDASAVPEIGPEHHSFKLMLRAYARARCASGGEAPVVADRLSD
jgi:hypothetical protein